MSEGKEIPSTWVLARLDEIGDWGSGGTPSRKNPAYYDGDIPWLKIGDLTDGPVWAAETTITQLGLEESSAKVLEPETVLLAMYGSIGKIGVTKIQCATNQAIAFCRNRPELIHVQFLFFALRFLRPKFVALGQGGTQQNISQTLLKQVEIPLPPLNEQRRIVEKIEVLFAELDKGEESMREVQKLLARYRQSVLKAAVTGQLTADWRAENAHCLEHGRDLLRRVLQTRRQAWDGRGKYKEPEGPNASSGPALPESWTWVSVDQILRAPLSNGRSVPDAPDGFPVLRLTALKEGRIDLAERKLGAWNADAARPFQVERHDVLVGRGNGSKQLVGRGGLVMDEPDAVAYPDTMIRIPLLLSCVEAEWFLQLWNSPSLRAQIERAAKTTAGIYKINQTDIRNFRVPLPSMEEQEEIADRANEAVSRIQILEACCRDELARSAALRQSILKDAFAGRLVPQDPDDEPAAELLARIRAERATEAPKPRRKAARQSA